jgi:nucleoside-diphosphate kinase
MFFKTISNAARKTRGFKFGLFGSGILLASYLVIQPFPVLADAKMGPMKPKTIVEKSAGIKGGIERTFIAIKPDGTQRSLVGTIIQRFEQKGYKLVGLKAIVPTKELANVHYADLKSKPFFNGLVNYMTCGIPVIAMVWEGPDVIRQGRRLIGATNPLDADPGSIRGTFCISVGRNIIHGSDSFESANIEIPLWFNKDELFDWELGNSEWIISQ